MRQFAPEHQGIAEAEAAAQELDKLRQELDKNRKEHELKLKKEIKGQSSIFTKLFFSI